MNGKDSNPALVWRTEILSSPSNVYSLLGLAPWTSRWSSLFEQWSDTRSTKRIQLCQSSTERCFSCTGGQVCTHCSSNESLGRTSPLLLTGHSPSLRCRTGRTTNKPRPVRPRRLVNTNKFSLDWVHWSSEWWCWRRTPRAKRIENRWCPKRRMPTQMDWQMIWNFNSFQKSFLS